MNSPARFWRRRWLASACALGLLAGAGCAHEQQARRQPTAYNTIAAPTGLPAFMAGSLFDRTVVQNNEPYNVSAYGLVGQLRGTGSCVAPATVRSYMIKELAREGFGDPREPIFGRIQPDEVLADNHYAIVRVDGLLPVGARKGDWMDVRVSCLPGNPTRSLDHGVLFETELKTNGANKDDPVGAIQVLAKAKGSLLVNPAYTLTPAVALKGAARGSLRSGLVMFNGLVMQDRPIYLRLRNPQRSTARLIEKRIWDWSGDFSCASAYDEGLVTLYVPRKYHGDWRHFIGVVQHLFLNDSPDFTAAKAKQLAAAAQKPNAPLEDISFCWEGLGKDALPFILPLLTDPSPDVSYAAARAAAFIGDDTGAAQERLVQMATTDDHPFRLSAVETLGEMPSSNALNHDIHALLDSSDATVRIEAYKILARNADPSVFTRIIAPADDPQNQKFALDVVDSAGPPIVYASRQGAPRIAIIGRLPEVRLPIMFSAIDDRLTISSRSNEAFLTVYFRDPVRRDPIRVASPPDLTEFIARLGGAGERSEDHLNFSYGEVLAILQAMSNSRQLVANDQVGRPLNVAFLMQDLPRQHDAIRDSHTPDPIAPTPTGTDLGSAVPASATAVPMPAAAGPASDLYPTR